MPPIRVIYKTGNSDYVSGGFLDSLIKLDEITHFYRASENRWINIKLDPIRGGGGGGRYPGPGRRRIDDWIDRLCIQVESR
jgi:hypothetical protein